MANAKRGETSFFVGQGKDRKDYTLRFSLNTLCTLEESLKKPFSDVYNGWAQGNISITEFRETVKAALGKQGREMSPEEVGDLIEDAGFELVMEKLMEAFENSALNVGPQEGPKEDPPKAETADGTGTSSSTMPSPPV
jgi:hypothetical protein